MDAITDMLEQVSSRLRTDLNNNREPSSYDLEPLPSALAPNRRNNIPEYSLGLVRRDCERDNERDHGSRRRRRNSELDLPRNPCLANDLFGGENILSSHSGSRGNGRGFRGALANLGRRLQGLRNRSRDHTNVEYDAPERYARIDAQQAARHVSNEAHL